MWRAFNLTNCDWSEIPREVGYALYKRNSDKAKASLETFAKGKIVDGTKLIGHWFPTIKADVFISHSHKDEESAIKCASWLKSNFDLESFIDSCVWGHANELLKLIDRHCLSEDGKTYDYDKRNRSTSHVHMMLSTAISAMLEACECVVFMNTPNSISVSESVSKTKSPWLFFELGTMRIIRRRKPSRMRLLDERLSKIGTVKAAQLELEYEVPLGELTPLTVEQLKQWKAVPRRKGKHPLDLLYEVAPER